MDMKKAFNKVSHKRMLWKLEDIGGLKGTLMKWMEDYLQGRQMRTVVRDEQLEWSEVISGVPQGSVLAPVMFLMYINMTDGLSSYVNLFADDTKVMRRVKDWRDCEELQGDLGKIYEWSRKWEMEFKRQEMSCAGNG